MGVICFSSLKGGVGKTTLSVSIAHAFAKRDCKTVLIDLDPSAHSTRYFAVATDYNHSVLAKLFLAPAKEIREPLGFITNVRPSLDIIPGGEELRHFMWGSGAKVFARGFPALIRELSGVYDHIVIDTAPDFSVLTRNSIAASDLVVVPVDPSIMSLDSLEALIRSAQHIKGPSWAIARTMITRNASRVNRLSAKEIADRLAVKSIEEMQDDEDEIFEASFSDPESFLDLLRSVETKKPQVTNGDSQSARNEDPVYLLQALTYRTEEQNRLSFAKKTPFDLGRSSKLASQYLAVARELEEILSMKGEIDFPLSENQENVSDKYPRERVEA